MSDSSGTFEIAIAPRPKQRRAISRLRAALRVARAGDRLRAAKERGSRRWKQRSDWVRNARLVISCVDLLMEPLQWA